MKYLFALLSLAGSLLAQTPDTPTPTTPATALPLPNGLGGARITDPEPKPYDKVITKDAFSRGAEIAQRAVDRCISKAANRETKLHVEDLKDQIVKALDPRFQPSAPAIGFLPIRTTLDGQESCWPDFAITVQREQ